MSQSALNGTQFFHGSSAFLQPGDVIQPGSAVGQNNYPRLQKWRSQSVWMTDKEKHAWEWADLGRGASGTGRLSVYRVEPLEAPQQRRKLGGGPLGREFTTNAARVVERLDIPHPEADMLREYRDRRGGQGTLPLPQSWSRTYDESWGGHPNHPARRDNFWFNKGPGTAHAHGLEDAAMENWKRQERLEGLRSKGQFGKLTNPRLF